MSSAPPRAVTISRPPSAREIFVNRAFRGLTHVFAWATIVLLAYILFEIGSLAVPAMNEYGADFVTGTTWDANREEFGVLPEIMGTLYTSLIALVIGGALGVAVAIVLSQGFLPPVLEHLMKNIVELLAAIPSVVYGLWGIFVVIPTVRGPAEWLHEHLGFLPFFDTRLSGPGILPASLVLSIMVLPTVAAISREAMVAVPHKLREAAFGLGATRWETILGVVLPTASAGIFGAVVLAFGRALGETMALAMLVGNANVFGWSLFSPGNTLASLLANHFPEAGRVEVGALMYAALVLTAITLIVNVIGSLIMIRASSKMQGLR